MNGCYLSKRDEELCNIAVSLCLQIVDLLLMASWVLIGLWLAQRGRKFGVKRNQLCEEACKPCTTFWMVWKERNRRAFEGKEVDFGRLKDS